MKKIFLFSVQSVIVALSLSACSTSTIRYTNQIETFNHGNCSIQVFYSKSTALEAGPIKEICTVEGSSAMSFDHSLEGAIKKNVPALCKCGVEMAYISSHHTGSELGMRSVSYVNLVGFKLAN